MTKVEELLSQIATSANNKERYEIILVLADVFEMNDDSWNAGIWKDKSYWYLACSILESKFPNDHSWCSQVIRLYHPSKPNEASFRFEPIIPDSVFESWRNSQLQDGESDREVMLDRKIREWVKQNWKHIIIRHDGSYTITTADTDYICAPGYTLLKRK